MHEASIVTAILDQLQQRKEAGDFTGKLQVVNLKVGKLTAVVPENLKFLYDILSGETGFAGSRLEIEMIPVICSCGACGNEFEMEELNFTCLHCGSTGLKVMSGRELLINTLEVDDGD